MGKMKEIFIQQQEEKELTPDYPDEPDMCSNKSPQILCPNCNKAMLEVDFATGEATCHRCGQDFIKIGENTVKYK